MWPQGLLWPLSLKLEPCRWSRRNTGCEFGFPGVTLADGHEGTLAVSICDFGFPGVTLADGHEGTLAVSLVSHVEPRVPTCKLQSGGESTTQNGSASWSQNGSA